MASLLPKLPSGMTIGTSMPSAKTEIARLFVPGSKPAATRSLFLTRYQPDFVTMSFAAGVAATFHCCARRCAAGAVGAGAVTPMPGVSGEDAADGAGGRIGIGVPPVVVSASLIFGVTGPCIVWTPFRSTSST